VTPNAPDAVDPYLEAPPGEGRSLSYEVEYPRVFMLAMRAAWRVTGDRVMSEDIAAEAMARAFARWDRVGGLSYLDAWVQRVAINLAIDETRRRRFRRRSDLASLRDPTEMTAGSVDLVAALRLLSRRQREAVVLHHLLDMPVEVVAAQLGLSTGAVSSHLHRGLEKLRAVLLREGVDDV